MMENALPAHVLSIDVVGFQINAYGIPAIVAATIIAVVVLHLGSDRAALGFKLIARRCHQWLRQSKIFERGRHH
ncbi:hypothetical protein ACF1BQ_025470 [Bradyrhizobium sp. RDT10]